LYFQDQAILRVVTGPGYFQLLAQFSAHGQYFVTLVFTPYLASVWVVGTDPVSLDVYYPPTHWTAE